MAHVILHIRWSDSVEVCSLDFCNLMKASKRQFSNQNQPHQLLKRVPLREAKLLLLVSSSGFLGLTEIQPHNSQNQPIESHWIWYILIQILRVWSTKSTPQVLQLITVTLVGSCSPSSRTSGATYSAPVTSFHPPQLGPRTLNHTTRGLGTWKFWGRKHKFMVNRWIVVFPVNME